MINKEGRVIVYDENNSRTVQKTDSVVDSIIDKFIDRANMGSKKYGTNLDREDLSLSDWLEHALQEHMDAILYLQKIKSMVDGKKRSY